MSGWWNRQSIKWKIPAILVGLLALLGASQMIVAYRSFERNAADIVRDRLSLASAELARLIGTGNVQRGTALRAFIAAPEFQPILTGAEDPDVVLNRLAEGGSGGSPVVILNSELDVIGSTPGVLTEPAMAELERVAGGALENPDQGVLSRLIEDRDSVYFWSALASDRDDGTRIILAQLRRMGERGSSDAVRALIGETTVLIANIEGNGPWLELDGMLALPPRDIDPVSGTYNRAGVDYYSNIAAIPGTPWQVVTETPVAIARERAAAYVGDTLPWGVLVLLLGGIAAWMIGRHYTQPMHEFASAARSFGNGDFSRRVDVSRGDELGLMAASFNGMAAEVENSYTQLEERVRHRTAELQAVNHELEAFSYSVSHDLRSPLRSIDGFSQALLEDYSPQLDSVAQDYLKRVRSGAQRMGHLIDDLLQLSRVTRQPITSEHVDLSAMVEQVVAQVAEADPERAVEVVIEPGLTAHGDRGLLQVAVRNLMDNAWKFTSRQPEPRIEFGCEDGTYFVRDNGAGFSMEYAHQLFTPFQRLHSLQEFTGTGIGLATVQRVILRHGGRVWAQAAVDEGATFHFTIGTMNGGDDDTSG